MDFNNFSKNILLGCGEKPYRIFQGYAFLQENEEMKCMKAGCCIFEHAKKCNHCFSCIGLINRKTVEELTAFETSKLLEYKTYQMNLDEFSAKVNRIYRRNGGQDTIVYSMNNDWKACLP